MKLALSSDRVNPFVVKELRQELRMDGFTFLFLAPQAALFCAALVELMVIPEDGSDARDIGGFIFWLTISVPLLILLPRRALHALGKEAEAETLELIMLTQVSPWRMIFGKWCALAAMTILFLCSVVPYVVLRYYLGDGHIAATWQLFVCLVFLSLFLSALFLNLSSFGRKKRVSGFFIFLLLFTAFFFGPWFVFWIYTVTAKGGLTSVGDGLSIVVLFPLALLSVLELAVTRVSSPHDALALRKRILTFALIGAASMLVWFEVGNAMLIFLIALAALLPVLVSSVTEEFHPVYRRRRLKDRALRSWIAYPGWPTGIIFALLGGFALVGLAVAAGIYEKSVLPFVLAEYAAAVLVPAAIILTVHPVRFRNAPAFCVWQLVLTVLCYLLHAPTFRVDGALKEFFPPAAMLVHLEKAEPMNSSIVIPLALSAISAFALFVLYRSTVRRYDEAEKIPTTT